MTVGENPYSSPTLEAEAIHVTALDPEAEHAILLLRKDLKLPAIGYLVSSVLTFAGVAWVAVVFMTLPTRGASESFAAVNTHLQWYWLLYLPFLLFAFGHAFIASLCMLQVKNRNFCLVSCWIAIVTSFPIGLPFAIWCLTILSRRETQQLLSQSVRSRSARRICLDRLFWPAAILLTGEVIMAVGILAPFAIDVGRTLFGDEAQFARHMQNLAKDFLGPLVSACSFVVITYCTIQMLRGRQYAVCVIGAILALIPLVTPLVILGIPFGIWALVILLRKDTRAAFAKVS